MLKFGTPTIALPLAIKKCTVQTGCTVSMYIVYYMISLLFKFSLVYPLFNFKCEKECFSRRL